MNSLLAVGLSIALAAIVAPAQARAAAPQETKQDSAEQALMDLFARRYDVSLRALSRRPREPHFGFDLFETQDSTSPIASVYVLDRELTETEPRQRGSERIEMLETKLAEALRKAGLLEIGRADNDDPKKQFVLMYFSEVETVVSNINKERKKVAKLLGEKRGAPWLKTLTVDLERGVIKGIFEKDPVETTKALELDLNDDGLTRKAIIAYQRAPKGEKPTTTSLIVWVVNQNGSMEYVVIDVSLFQLRK